MVSHSSSSYLTRIARLMAAILGASALIALILHVFSPARPVFSETEAVGLQVDKVGPNTGLAGRTITYSVIVTNASGVPLSGVVVTDTWNTQEYTGTYEVSGGFTVTAFTLVTQTQPRYAQFNLTDLPSGARGVITITMVLSPLQQPYYNRIPNFNLVGNSVVISTSTPNVTAGNDRVDTTIVGPLLKLTKTVTPTSVIKARPGRLITYTFHLENLNRSDTISATNVVVTERLPANTLFYAAYPASQAAYYPVSNTVQWNLVDPLPVSGTVYLTLTVRVTPTVGNVSMNNLKTNCGARSDELPLFVLCDLDANTFVDDLFEKVAETISPPSQAGSTISRTFPNRVMTYTVYVYNPFPDPVSGMIVTDTLPTSAVNNPSQTFQYIGIVASALPGPPSVISQSTRIVAWQLPQIPGWGVYTFTFQAFVPPQMRIDDNQVERIYLNRLDGNSSGMILPFNDGGHDDRMKVRVVRQIEIVKVVTPTQQTYGQAVTYTLILSNNGPTTIRNIYLTDTLPTGGGSQWCGFVWDGNVDSQKLITASGNLVAWGPFTVTANSQLVVGAFRAKVFGGLNATCRNTVEGYSPDTYIVKMTQLAPVVVEVPFRYSKTANPTSVVLGGNIEYTVRRFNVGGIDATMDYFEDILPPGFYFNGSPVYSQVLSPPLVLQANHGNEYMTAFTVDVLSTDQCDSLPKEIWQEIGTFGMRIIDPPDLARFWTNSARAAPVLVHPQARVYKTANPPGALAGDAMTFTIVLSNNTASPISNVRVTDTLPNGFVFGGALPGTDPPISIVPPNVTWINQVIPANGTRSLAFTVITPITVGNYSNNVKASSDTNPLICIPKFTLQPVSVNRGLIEVNKTANPSSVGPFATFQYNISLKNNGPYTVTVARFTETLPGLVGYNWTFVSMQSGDPVPDTSNLHAPAWTNLTIGPNRIQNLRFIVRTGREVGTYPNNIFPAIGAGYMTATLPARWELTRPNNYNGAPVTVVPGVGLLKEVDRPAALAGEDVVYTITLVNVSGQTINNVRVTDTLPSGFVFKYVFGGDVGAPVSTNPLVWALGNVANNQQRVMVFRVGIPANQPSGTYYNRVSASADNISIAPTGNIAPVRVSGIPALDMSKNVDPATVIAGREVTYTMTLANNDPDGDVINARITDTLPPNFSFSAMISGPNPASTTPQVVWTGVNVPTQTVQTWVFRARVASGTPDGVYFNQVDGSSPQTVFNSTGQTAPVEVIATPTFDVQVSKSDDAPTATIGGRVVYTIHYTNTLNRLGLTAKNVVLTETFSPAGYLIPDAPDWDFVSTGVYTRLIGDVPAGWSDAVTFALQIDSGIPVEYLGITNTVQIGARPPNDVPEAVEQPASNNISTDVDTIRGADIVVVGFSVLPSNPQQGKPITVMVTLQNQGVDATIGPESTVISGWFGIDLYVKPDGSPPPAGPDDRYLGACPTQTNYCPGTIRYELYEFVKEYNIEGLAPGETWVVTFRHTLPDGGKKWLYTQADVFWGDGNPASGAPERGRIREANEQNNIYGPVEINVIGNVYLPVVFKNR